MPTGNPVAMTNAPMTGNSYRKHDRVRHFVLESPPGDHWLEMEKINK